MARTRSIRIRESLDELEQLRQYYQGRPQARRLLFLAFLKENPKQTIVEAARKAGISDRRGRYWWDAYRDNGLQGLLERRVWKVEEKVAENKEGSYALNPSGAGAGEQPSDISYIPFLNALASISSITAVDEWIRAFREALLAFLPDVDYAVVTVRSGVNVVRPGEENVYHVFHQNVLTDGTVERNAKSSKEYKDMFRQLIEEGRQRGFPFKDYHPPVGFDFYLEPGKRGRTENEAINVYIGSMLLLRKVTEAEMSQTTIDFVERLRPFLGYVISDFVARNSLDRPGAELFQDAVRRVANDIKLSSREHQVLFLEMQGHSYQEIADILHISLNTVQSHIRSVYKKTGVNKLPELFAKYFTPRDFFEGRKEEQN